MDIAASPEQSGLSGNNTIIAISHHSHSDQPEACGMIFENHSRFFNAPRKFRARRGRTLLVEGPVMAVDIRLFLENTEETIREVPCSRVLNGTDTNTVLPIGGQ